MIGTSGNSPSKGMPLAVYLLGATIFAVTAPEVMAAGIMQSPSTAFGVSVGNPAT